MNILEVKSDLGTVSRLVVRVKTSCWLSDKGIHYRKDVIPMRRKSVGYDFLTEDAEMCGALEVFHQITNIDSVEDGLYEVGIAVVSRDWETGAIENVNYKLHPYSETP
ncbi:hypothetical protein [Sinimarinibacterium sp. NLF-5-8]|uniref:hypothetical protein n=1 Tax=Sinimarinibacterium sp. NLF-5-8 TaxID=2698684 RepID=UPI00137BBE62|nr:hypothetical protein [Sinimarinibacterium sp. NLF-5-8]QHS09053.1 hypothetical protein GT972_02095 [Sinimarinibacterium sp. NLF-5-8]